MFYKGNLDSIVDIQNVLKLFYSYSGLQLNCARSELFSSRASKDRDLVGEIQQVTGFKIGLHPVRYFGVPLVTGRLSTQGCAPLVERVITRINS